VVWDTKGVAALLYLTVFGSIVGYTSYVIALTRLPISIVSLYTYINPVVAAALGWLFYREPFGRREVLAMLVIFAGVAIVKGYGHRK
jgi:drug/metabolite transporter (DMT)-like permease